MTILRKNHEHRHCCCCLSAVLLILATVASMSTTIFFADGLIINVDQQVQHQTLRLSRRQQQQGRSTKTSLMIASSSSSMSGDRYYDHNFDDDEMVLQQQQSQQHALKDEDDIHGISRRSMMAITAMTSVLLTTPANAAHAAAKNNGLVLNTASSSGLRWADAKVGTGSDTPSTGQRVSIDYSMASTAGRFPSIYTTKDKGEPYTWILGDGTTIKGIEIAIQGSTTDNIPPMKPGGIRRLIVPNTLGYNDLIVSAGNLSAASSNKRCTAGNDGSIGPIPPKDAPDGAYQRWYQFYCNPRIPYQPDLVLDIKLYGKR
jgi:FKBP-type peptidyl-prolyl cis-trans isomerase